MSLPVYFIKAERYVHDPNGVPKLCPVTLEIGMHFTGSIAYVKEIGAPETPNASRERGKAKCRQCNGEGLIADYVGLEMRCVGVECDACKGTGFVVAETPEAETRG